jgi:hypothetical protein
MNAMSSKSLMTSPARMPREGDSPRHVTRMRRPPHGFARANTCQCFSYQTEFNA